MKTINKISIGIDVATKNSGIAVIINGKIHFIGLIQTNPQMIYSGEKIKQDTLIIYGTIQGLLTDLKNLLKIDNSKDDNLTEFTIALESSTHGINSVAQKLSTYIGIYAAALVSFINISFVRNTIDLKLVNPRQWSLRAFGQILLRDELKQASSERAERLLKKDFPKNSKELEFASQNDIADAINIASLANIIKDNLLIGQERRSRHKKITKNKNSLLDFETKLTKLVRELNEKKAKAINKAMTAKKPTKTAQELKEQATALFANSNQLIRLKKYVAEIKKIDADNKLLKKFKIIKDKNA